MNKIVLKLDLLEKLVQAPGLPGREIEVARLIREAISTCSKEVESDRLGNVVAHLPGAGRRVMFVAHMDEVGLIVRRITEDGFLLVERMGGMGVRSLPGSHLTLWTDEGRIPAQVGVLPLQLDNPVYLNLEDLYVDIGATSRSEAEHPVGSRGEVEAMGVQVGDGLTWASPLQRIGEDRIRSKALDDRLGCFTLLSLAELIGQQERRLQCDLFLAFVVQEETMLTGGMPVVRSYQPDVVIGVDGTLAFDTPDLKGKQCDIAIGKGPCIKWFDAIRGKLASFVPHWELAQSIRRTARQNDIPLQPEVVTGMSTAVTLVPFSLSGVETAALSLPIRYHHSPVETADLGDVRDLVRLLAALVLEEDAFSV